MGNDDRLETALDWQALEHARRFAWYWHWTSPCDRIDSLCDYLSVAQMVRTTMPPDLFGFVAGVGLRWRIEINDRLPLAAARATLGHEFGHTLQHRPLGTAFCAPRALLPVVEQEAHAIGAVLTVPYAAVEGLTLGDINTARQIAVDLTIPVSYVRMRAALSVFLEERGGSRHEASVYLAASMAAHQLWMANVSDFMVAQGA